MITQPGRYVKKSKKSGEATKIAKALQKGLNLPTGLRTIKTESPQKPDFIFDDSGWMEPGEIVEMGNVLDGFH
jgi:hypothetical protein